MKKGSANTDVGQTSPEKEDDHCTCSDTNGSEVLHYVCRHCQQPICSYCKFANHRNHELQTVETVAEEIRNDITKYVSGQKKEDKMSSIHKTRQIIANMKKELVVSETQEVDKIDQQLNELKKKLDEIRTELVQKVTDVVRRDLENLNKAERDLKRTAANITRMCDAAGQMIAEANDVDVVRRGYSCCEELNDVFQTDIPSPPSKGPAFSVKFIVAGTDKIRLIDLVGQVDDGKIRNVITSPVAQFLWINDGKKKNVITSPVRISPQRISPQAKSSSINDGKKKINDGKKKAQFLWGISPQRISPQAQFLWEKYPRQAEVEEKEEPYLSNYDYEYYDDEQAEVEEKEEPYLSNYDYEYYDEQAKVEEKEIRAAAKMPKLKKKRSEQQPK